MIEIILGFLLVIFAILSLRDGIIKSFKISYYEQKLKNIGVDISSTKNVGLIDILKM